MKSKLPILTKQLTKLNKEAEAVSKKKEAIERLIKTEQDKNKPKSIIDQIKTFKDIIKLGKPSKEALAIINYNGVDSLVLFARDFTTLALISKAYNQGWEPKMDSDDNRYYAWFYLSTGFAFNSANYDYVRADTASASRLCFERADCALDAAGKFLPYYERAIKSGFLTIKGRPKAKTTKK